jgi:hypothetical protein
MRFGLEVGLKVDDLGSRVRFGFNNLHIFWSGVQGENVSERASSFREDCDLVAR